MNGPGQTVVVSVHAGVGPTDRPSGRVPVVVLVPARSGAFIEQTVKRIRMLPAHGT